MPDSTLKIGKVLEFRKQKRAAWKRIRQADKMDAPKIEEECLKALPPPVPHQVDIEEALADLKPAMVRNSLTPPDRTVAVLQCPSDRLFNGPPAECSNGQREGKK